MLRVLPQHSTFSAGFSPIKNRYLFINSCSQIRPPPSPLKKKTVEGVVVGEVPTSLGLCLVGSLSQ